MCAELSSAPWLALRDRDIKRELESCFATCVGRSWSWRTGQETFVIESSPVVDLPIGEQESR